MKTLVIIDPQIDFVTGSLAVPGAVEAMAYLASWIREHIEQYNSIYVSMDQHPIRHCSFATEGGLWPSHCVRYSAGAAIEPLVMQALQFATGQGKPVHFIEKATSEDKDSYSAFADSIPTELLTAEQIYLAGLAGDYCVAASEADLLRAVARERIVRLEPAIAWINPPQD